MKKITFLLAAMLFITTVKTNAQVSKTDCEIKYNLFSGDYKSKNTMMLIQIGYFY